jgi:hypothetical protein
MNAPTQKQEEKTYQRRNYNLIGGVYGADTGLIDTGVSLRVKHVFVDYNGTGEKWRPVCDAHEYSGQPFLEEDAEGRIVQHPKTREYGIYFEGKKYGVFVGTKKQLNCGTLYPEVILPLKSLRPRQRQSVLRKLQIKT